MYSGNGIINGRLDYLLSWTVKKWSKNGCKEQMGRFSYCWIGFIHKCGEEGGMPDLMGLFLLK